MNAARQAAIAAALSLAGPLLPGSLLPGSLLAGSLLAGAGPVLAADAASGEKLFRTQCSACHAVQPGQNRVGPSLAGIVGRVSGTVPGFQYSEANKSAAITWNAETLDPYLLAPGDVVPGTTMTYPGLPDDGKRADLIAYLQTLK